LNSAQLVPFQVLDDDDAYQEYIRCSPIPPRPENESKPFESADPSENSDNSPTRWVEVRTLKNDEERKSFARKQFGNRESANPTQNTTVHCHRRKLKAEDQVLNNSEMMYVGSGRRVAVF
jgi:hypothetical protein